MANSKDSKTSSTQPPKGGRKLNVGVVRASYAHVWEPTIPVGSTTPKYSVSLIIPKANTKLVEAIRAAIDAAIEDGKKLWGGKVPPRIKLPLRDGDAERPDNAEYADSYFLSASSKQKPGIVDKNVQKIIDTSEFYSGVYCNANVNFFPFDKAGNKGVGCGLNHLQKVRDGEALGGRGDAEDEFEALEESSDELLGGGE